MRKFISIFVIMLMFIGCSKKDEFSILLENISTQNFAFSSTYVNCDLDVTEISEDLYRYRVVISQPKANLENIKAFVVCDKAAENTIPSIGFYENDNCNLYIDKIDIDNYYYEGISLMGLSKESNMECQLYLSYQIKNKVYEEYIILRGQ